MSAHKLSYAESLQCYETLMARIDDPCAQLRGHQIFSNIRAGHQRSGLALQFRRLAGGIFQYTGHVILALWTLLSAALIRVRSSGASGHFVVDMTINGKADHRSAYLRRVLGEGSVVALYHYSDAWVSIRSLGTKGLSTYPESWVKVLWPLWAMQMWWTVKVDRHADRLLAMAYREASYGRLYEAMLRALFLILRIRRILLLDDPRNVGVYCSAARSLGVSTVGYMHGKFNRYHVGLKSAPFDVYLVWSQYFKSKIISMWGGKYPGEIITCGLIRDGARECISEVKAVDSLCILWLDEDEVPLSEIKSYFEALSKVQGVRVLFRRKPRPVHVQTEMPAWYIGAFPCDEVGGFWDSLSQNSVDLVIGCHSTALLEAAMAGVIPLAISSSFDYANDFSQDGVVIPCASPAQLVDQIEELKRSPDRRRPSTWPQLQLAISPFEPSVVDMTLLREGFVLNGVAPSGRASNDGLPPCRS